MTRLFLVWSQLSLSIPLLLAAPQPDLAFVGGISLSPNPVTAGNSVTVSFRITNQGTASASWSDTFIQIIDGAGFSLTDDTFTTFPISAGESRNESYTVSIPSGAASGTYRVEVTLDINDDLNQSNIFNDFASANLQTRALQPDLAFLGSVSVSPNPVSAGNSVTISFRIINQGNAYAGSSDTFVQMIDGSGFTLTSRTFPTSPLSAGQWRDESYTLGIPATAASGTYRVSNSHFANGRGP